ncbi:hypothetical protein BST61_g228 [Cercospora zeina]
MSVTFRCALRIPAFASASLASITGPGPLHITLDTSGHEQSIAAMALGAASQHVHPSLRRRISTCAGLQLLFRVMRRFALFWTIDRCSIYYTHAAAIIWEGGDVLISGQRIGVEHDREA